VKYRLFRAIVIACMVVYTVVYVGDMYVNKLCTEWRKEQKQIWNLPYDAHGDIVTGL